MTEEDCVELISKALGQEVEFDPAQFPSADSRVILHRMLNNLRNSYARSGRLLDLERLNELQRDSLK
jgi:regulator of sirC expression with transglutaminase-like and TPR domain